LAQKLAGNDFIISVEMSPPRGYMPHKVLAGARLLAEAGADVINVADAPLARMRMSAWAVAYLLQREVGVESVLHFPTRGRNLLRVQGDLLAAHALGVRNLFVIMGDPTSVGDYPQATDTYDLAPSALIELVKQRFNSGRDHAGQSLGEPTRFMVGCALNMCSRDLARELRVLRRKIRSGADFALTQPVFSAQSVRDFVQGFHATEGEEILPIMVGVLPLHSERHARFLHNEVPGMEIPGDMMERIASASDAPTEGVRIAMELMAELRTTMGVRGVYLVPPFGRYEIAAEIMQALDRRRDSGQRTQKSHYRSSRVSMSSVLISPAARRAARECQSWFRVHGCSFPWPGRRCPHYGVAGRCIRGEGWQLRYSTMC
jgi:homocysteine S-methyltransferase